ncbi:hypothetical protein CTAYLR_009079 [Chrysophaeum taylorii]|uniref:RING-type domain-containing protein n=1 Tax=Chrysophaeum taylorii TaxID=2483200 RepID=A0AAD7XLH8_9STRA|nr:hypothetical protein CTAYLR_009079 [Chrysophaeum taylorii]
MDCAICLEPIFLRPETVLPCRHRYCTHCLVRLLDLRCPQCRAAFPPIVPRSRPTTPPRTRRAVLLLAALVLCWAARAVFPEEAMVASVLAHTKAFENATLLFLTDPALGRGQDAKYAALLL